MQSNVMNSVINLWPRFWPRAFVVLLGIVQSLLAWIILGLQCGILALGVIILCDSVNARYIMGFVSWVFFIASSIAVCCVSCCNRLSFGFATYGLLQNILTLIFSSIMIDYNRKFIDYPYYYNLNSPNCDVGFEDLDNARSISLTLSKAQLAANVLMLVSSLAYMGLYVYTVVRTYFARNSTFNSNPNHPGPVYPVRVIQSGPNMQYQQYSVSQQAVQPVHYGQKPAGSIPFESHESSQAANQYTTPAPPQNRSLKVESNAF